MTKNKTIIKLAALMAFVCSSGFGQITPADLLNQWTSNTVEGTTYDHCKQWKITYPTGAEDKDLCSAGSNEFYYVNADEDGIVFRAPIRSDNGTTPLSSNIRSELREREVDNGSDIYWTTEGYHAIYVKQAFTHLPINKDEVVGTQIHGNKAAGIDDALVLRLNGDELFLSFNGNKLRPDLTIKTGYVLGTVHEVIFEVIDDKHYVYYSEDGNLKDAFLNGTASSYYVKDSGDEVLMDINYGESYFKVGNYTQSNADQEGDDTDDPDNYGEVIVYDMFVDHDGSDNTVIIDDATCDETPTSISLGDVDETTASVSWDLVSDVDHYKVRHAVAGSDVWVVSGSITGSDYTITGLSNDVSYEWQVRAKCADGTGSNYADGQGDDFTTGTVVNVTCVASAPAEKTVSDIAETDVTLNWTYDALIDHYNVRYRVVNTDVWTTLTSLRESEGEFTVSNSLASMSLTGLTAETDYEWQVRAKCADGTANDYADGQGDDFTTGSGEVVVGVCNAVAPAVASVNAIAETSVTFNWSFDSEMDHYNVRYRVVNTDVWTTLTSLRESEGEFTVSNSLASMSVSGLTADSDYEWQVRAKCADATASEYTDGQGDDFTTDAADDNTGGSTLVPSDLLNLWNSNEEGGEFYEHCEQWKITYPTGAEDKTLCGEANNEFFYVNDTDDGIVFRAPIRSDNGTTPLSSNIRSELREREIDGGSDIYWTTEGYHAIYVKQAFTHLPINKDEIVGTQIHGNKAAGIDDALVLRLNGDELFLSFNGNKLRPDLTIKTGYVLGTIHEVIFEVIDDKHYVYYSEDGNLKDAFLNGTASSYYVTDGGDEILMDINYGESYFKVGNYTQSNADEEGDDTDDPNNYGEVVVYDMFVDHTGEEVVTSLNGSLESQVSVSPNPALNAVNVSNSNGSTLEVYSLNGALQSTVSIESDNQEVSLTSLTTGVYLLKFTNESGTTVKRLIKE